MPRSGAAAIQGVENPGTLSENLSFPLKGLFLNKSCFWTMSGRVYRFGAFELLSQEGELRTTDSCVRLQEKPLLLLTALLDHPQELVTRQQLRERMWGSETFVDYEQGINVAIKKVRQALSDSAENPRFIETIAKKGYRFLLPVEIVDQAVPANFPTVEPGRVPEVAAGPVSESPRSHRRSRLVAFAAAGALLLVGIWLFQVEARARHSTQIHSLAVLPLQNLSPDAGQEYFADGITEELITDLAQTLPFRVISRTSVMRYKQTSEPITQIARELGVEAIVEGAVARSGNRVTVTIQLIDATEDRHLWAQRYDRNVGDLLGMEAELSQEIASQVGGTLSARPVNLTVSAVDPEVYELCLMGRYHWNRRTPAGLSKAIEYFQDAIRRDPNYPPAYAGLADAYLIMPSYNSVDTEDSYRKAEIAARRALQLDDTLAESHATLGMLAIHHWFSESDQAEREFRRALQLNPNYATAHHWFSYYLIFMKRLDEALGEMELARRLDPLSPIINADEGHLLYAIGRYGKAKERLQYAIELAPGLGQPHETLALIALVEGRATESVAQARAGLALDGSNPRSMAEAGYVLAATGHVEEAQQLLTTLNELVERDSAAPVFPAFIYLGLGQRSQALNVLDKAAHKRIDSLIGLGQWSTIIDPLRNDPQYRRLTAEADHNHL